jgi:tight adherence protein B
VITAVIMTFGAVFLGILAAFFAVTAARQSPAAELKRRLRRLAERDSDGGGVAIATDLLKEISPAERFLIRLPLLGNLQRLVAQSGLHIKGSSFLLLIAAASFAGFAVMLALKKNLLLATLAAVMVTGVLVLFLQHLRQKREHKFTEQLPDALTMIGRSLRAGHSFTSAIELVGQELAEPAGGLFKTAYEQQKLGMRITDAIAMLQDRIESLDLRFFVTIVNINYEVGGNLAEILDKLADTIRSRLQLRRQVRVFTAQGRLSGYILAIMPVATFVMLYMMLPGYVDVLYKETKGQYILAAALCMEATGFLIIRKIIDIRI